MKTTPTTLAALAALAALLAMTLLIAACGSDETEPGTAQDDGGASEFETGAPDEEGDDTARAPEPDTDAPAEAEPEDAQAAGGGGQPGQAPAGFVLNGFRYCEILISVPGDNGEQVTEVWGTPGVDPCDDADWNALDPDAVMAENDASSIHMNGPRYFTVDGTADTAPGSAGVGIAAGGEAALRAFGEVTMTLLATVDGGDTESAPYVPDLVVRTTTWTFDAGTEIYELTDPDGNVYIMQSYALYVDPSLTADDLPTLADRLDLPEGWSYSSRVLDADVEVALSPDGAWVVTDDLGNSYQRNG